MRERYSLDFYKFAGNAIMNTIYLKYKSKNESKIGKDSVTFELILLNKYFCLERQTFM